MNPFRQTTCHSNIAVSRLSSATTSDRALFVLSRVNIIIRNEAKSRTVLCTHYALKIIKPIHSCCPFLLWLLLLRPGITSGSLSCVAVVINFWRGLVTSTRLGGRTTPSIRKRRAQATVFFFWCPWVSLRQGTCRLFQKRIFWGIIKGGMI